MGRMWSNVIVSAALVWITLLLDQTEGASLRAKVRASLEEKVIEKLNLATELLNQACSASDINCQGTEIDAEIQKLNSLTAGLNSGISPVQTTLNDFSKRKTSLVTLTDSLSAISTALSVAGLIPTVGVLFSSMEKAMSAIVDPMKVLKKGADSVDKTLISPWENSLGSILDAANTVLNGLPESVAGLTNLLSTPGVCIQPLLTTLVPALRSPINTFKLSLPQLLAALKSINTAIEKLNAALTSNVWQQIKNALGKLNIVDLFNPITKLLSPLADLLNKKISLPWVSIYTKGITGAHCNADEEMGTLGTDCYPKCPSGYSGAELLCVQSCYDGRTDLGLACSNPTSVAKGTLEHSKYYPPWESPPLGRIDTWCDSGKIHKGVMCYDSCGDGYDLMTAVLVEICAKQCPTNMKRSPEGTTCIKDSKGRLATGLKCNSGWTLVGTTCVQNCNSGAVDTGLICVEKSQLSFSVKDIANEFAKIKKDIENLPVFKEINDAISTGVRTALNAVLSGLNSLNIPVPSEIPSLNLNFAVADLPIVDLSNALNVNLPMNVDTITNLFDGLANPFSDLINSFGLPAGWDDCTDLNCVFTKLNLPKVDWSKFTQIVKNAAKLPELIAQLPLHVTGCQTEQIVSVDVTAKVASLLKLPQNQVQSCKVDLPICTKFKVADSFEFYTQSLAAVIFPLSDALNSLFGGPPVLLQQSMKTKQGTSAYFDQLLPFYSPNNWRKRYYFPAVPLFWLTKSGAGTTFTIGGVIRIGKAKYGLGGYFTTTLSAKFAMDDIVENGQRRMDYVLGSDITFAPFFAKDTPTTLAAMYLSGLDLLAKYNEDMPKECIKRKLEVRNVALDYELDPTRKECKDFVDAANKLNEGQPWDWTRRGVTGQTLKSFLTQYPPTDPFWVSKNGVQLANKMANYISNLMETLFTAYKKLTRSMTGGLTIFHQMKTSISKLIAQQGTMIGSTVTFPKAPGAVDEHIVSIAVKDVFTNLGATVGVNVVTGKPQAISLKGLSLYAVGLADHFKTVQRNKRIRFELDYSYWRVVHSLSLSSNSNLPKRAVAGDLDMNGISDIFCLSGNRQYYLAKPSGTSPSFDAPAPLGLSATWCTKAWEKVNMVDMNNDNAADALCLSSANGGDRSVIIQDIGTRTFPSSVTISMGSCPSGVSTWMNINGDGSNDLVCKTFDKLLVQSVEVDTARLSFTPTNLFNKPNPCGALDISYGDIDGDGKDDAICHSSYLGRVDVKLNTASGYFQKSVYVAQFCPTDKNGQDGYETFGVADVNNDGKADLVCSRRGVNSVMYSKGDGTFDKPQEFNSGYCRDGVLLWAQVLQGGRPNGVCIVPKSNDISILEKPNSTPKKVTLSNFCSNPGDTIQVGDSVLWVVQRTAAPPPVAAPVGAPIPFSIPPIPSFSIPPISAPWFG